MRRIFRMLMKKEEWNEKVKRIEVGVKIEN